MKQNPDSGRTLDLSLAEMRSMFGGFVMVCHVPFSRVEKPRLAMSDDEIDDLHDRLLAVRDAVYDNLKLKYPPREAWQLAMGEQAEVVLTERELETAITALKAAVEETDGWPGQMHVHMDCCPDEAKALLAKLTAVRDTVPDVAARGLR